MKIFAISDLHLSIHTPKPMDIFGREWEDYLDRIVKNWQAKIADDDLVLIAGDISWAMRFEQALLDLEWINNLNGKKILLRGNHDYWWKSITAMRASFPKTIYAVQNDCLRFSNILLCGTRGWNLPEDKGFSQEDKKIYLREVERLKLSLASMQKMRGEDDRVIALMHFPPFNSRRESNDFTRLLEDFKVDVCVYGHLHGKKSRSECLTTLSGIDYYLTSCDKIDNDPIEISFS